MSENLVIAVIVTALAIWAASDAFADTVIEFIRNRPRKPSNSKMDEFGPPCGRDTPC